MFQVKMLKMDFLEASIEISSSYSDSSEVGDLNIGCDFKSYRYIGLSQKNKIKLSAFNVVTVLIKWGEKPT